MLAVTRSGKQYQIGKRVEDKVMKDPKVWEEQKKVRQGCIKEIQKLQKNVVSKQDVLPLPLLSQKEENLGNTD